jgi:outer membrane protein insertion porin family
LAIGRRVIRNKNSKAWLRTSLQNGALPALAPAAVAAALMCCSPCVAQSTDATTSPALPAFSESGSIAGSSAADAFKGRTVEDVRVIGNAQVSTAVILNLVRTHEGDKFDPATVAEDYQRIYGLRKFSDVEAKVQPTDKGVIVIFSVTEQQQIKRINFIGNVSLDTQTVLNAIDLKAGESIDQFRISLAKQAIENLYRDKNFPFAHVDVDRDLLARQGQVTFIIVEGPNVRIRKITFRGDNGPLSFSTDRLKSQLASKTWIFIIRPGTFDPNIVEDDVAALRRYYQNKGFFDVRVGRKLIWSPDLREMEIDFVIEEGPRYRVDRVVFTGNGHLSQQRLRQDLKMVEGVDYDNDIVERDVRQMVRAYSPLGYIYQEQSNDPAYLRIEPRTIFSSEPGHMVLEYDISEGRPFRLGRIIVKGNERSMDKLVLREMHVVPGQLYNSGEIQDAIERIKGTPYFSNVTITPVGDDPTTRDVLVEVTEAKTAQFSVGAGINSNGGVGGNLTYEQRNFDIADLPTSLGDVFSDRAFIGAGQDFRATLEPGTQQTQASLRFTEPYILDQPFSLTNEIYYRDRTRESYDDVRLGDRISLGHQFNYVYSGAITLRAENVDIRNIQDKEVRSDQILALSGNNALTSVGVQFRRDTTTRGLLPSKGTTTTIGIESYGLLGGDFQFEKLTGSFDYYTTLYEDLLDRKTILRFYGDVGWIFGGDDPFFERFYGGGIGSLRGFSFRGVSPRDGPSIDRVGGDFSATGTVEVSFPLATEILRGVVFTDFGTVEHDVQIGVVRSSVGAGIRLTLPFLGQVPIALDFALPVTKDHYDDTQFVSFSLGFTE